MRIILILLTIFITSYSDNSFADLDRKYQLNLNAGTDNPEKGESRTANTTLLRFAISTKTTTLRLVNSFTYMTGGGITQGEFAMGVYIYPFSRYVSAAPILPFIAIEGLLGVGLRSDQIKLDSGYGLMLGIDFQFFKSAGLTVAVEQHNATDSSYRFWVGIYKQGL